MGKRQYLIGYHNGQEIKSNEIVKINDGSVSVNNFSNCRHCGGAILQGQRYVSYSVPASGGRRGGRLMHSHCWKEFVAKVDKP